MTEFNKRREKPYEKRNSTGARFQRNESKDSYKSNRSYSDGGERKSRFSDRSERSNDRSYPPRKSYKNDVQSSERSFERKPYERKSFGDRPYSERKPYERKSFGDRPYTERKPYERKSYDKKTFDKKTFERKPFERKSFDDRSFEHTSFDEKPRKTFRKFDRQNDTFEGKRPAWFEGRTGISRRGEQFADKDDTRNYRPRKEYSAKKYNAPKLRMLDIFENKEQELPQYKEPEKKAAEVEKDEVRLNKFIANAGVCSRREADELILSGKITVNGEVKNELGTRINPKTDNVLFDGKELQSQKKVYILLNKPKDTISTKNDPENRRTVYDIIAGACNENVEAVGRLDRNTTGVFLFTNDGDLTQKILHPKFNKMKIYHVHLDKNLKADDFESIAAGVELEDGMVEIDDLQFVGSEKNQVGIQIHSGKNHVVKRIFEHFGYTVEKLDRVYFAGLTKKNLPRGKWRFLSRKEVEVLKQGAYE
ncbi:MAG: pseudouridine synthase [Bacteroidales bacterium]|jgi:23S rRNA pseudouridine2605 synthase|nr:pseudouridine synthase [Bacteroidales bacterium]